MCTPSYTVRCGSLERRVAKKLEESLQGCDTLMQRYMAGASLTDRVASVHVVSKCGLKPSTQVMRESRLIRYGHMKRRKGDGVLGELMEMEVPRSRPNFDRTKCEQVMKLSSTIRMDSYALFLQM